MNSHVMISILKTKSKLINIMVSVILMAFLLNVTSSCRFYYHIINENNISAERLLKYKDDGKYFILHTSNSARGLAVINIQGDTISGVLNMLPFPDRGYKTMKTEGDIRYIRRSNPEIGKEVHIYTSMQNPENKADISIPISTIEKIDVYEYSTGRTLASWILPPVIIIGGVALIYTITSCPFIYSYDMNSYTFEGEIYGGATYPSLERNDYMPLPGIKPTEDKYRLKISNELKEIQFTNNAELLVIRHPKNNSVLIDKYGQIQTISSPQKMISAISLNARDYTNSVAEKDSNLFLFNECNTSTSLNGLILTFDNSNNAKTGKLIVSAKNSLWADYAYGKFTELFGTYYAKWNDKQKQVPAKRQIKRILDQDIPLSVYLETDKGWEFIDFFNVVGPLSARTMVMPIDLSKAGSGKVRIKLESGFMFWELDYAGIDYSQNTFIDVITLKPDSVIDNIGKDVKALLFNDDNKYLTQVTGDEVNVSYNIPADFKSKNNDYEQTVILHSRGYYETIREYKNKPDWSYLLSLRSPHSFTKFSIQEYERAFMNNSVSTASK